MVDFVKLLFIALQHNILGDKQLRSRIVGFRAELEFQKRLLKRGAKLLSGGMLIPTKVNQSALTEPIFFTVVSDKENPDDYLKIYEKFQNLNVQYAFIIVFDESESKWSDRESEIKLKIPPLQVLEFTSGLWIERAFSYFLNKFQKRNQPYSFKKIPENKLIEISKFLEIASRKDLKKLYVERLIFDVFLASNHIIGIPSDIDLVLINKTEEIILCEIKEKDLAKRIVGFGLDLHRIRDLLEISNKTNLPYYVIVRNINNQIDREILDWKIIEIHDFANKCEGEIIEGGFGMRSESSYNPTKICKVENFSSISKD